jgi:hypothetical protein
MHISRLVNDNTLMKVTRRSIARMLAAAAAVPQSATSQTPSPDADLDSAREQLKTNAHQIAKVKLPMAIEPAFHFKA